MGSASLTVEWHSGLEALWQIRCVRCSHPLACYAGRQNSAREVDPTEPRRDRQAPSFYRSRRVPSRRRTAQLVFEAPPGVHSSRSCSLHRGALLCAWTDATTVSSFARRARGWWEWQLTCDVFFQLSPDPEGRSHGFPRSPAGDTREAMKQPSRYPQRITTPLAQTKTQSNATRTA